MGERFKNNLLLIGLIVLPIIWLLATGLPSKFSTNLLDLVPAESLSGDDARSMRAANALLAENVFLSVDGLEDSKEKQSAVALLEQLVAREEAFSGVVISNEDKFPESVWETLQTRKLPLFLARWIQNRKAKFEATSSDQNLSAWLADEQMKRLEAFLESPEGMAYAAQIPSDPLLLLPEALNTLRQFQPEHAVVSNDTLLAWIALAENPFDSDAQESIEKAVAFVTDELAHAFPNAAIETGGVYALARESASASKREVARLNIITAFIVFILLSLLLRRASSILLVLIPLTCAILWALAIGILVFGQIHVFALGMSAVLLGLAVDYGIHAEAHRTLGRGRDKSPWGAIKRPLMAGCLSTCIGFSVMAFTPIPALKQVAVLVPGGLLAALVSVYLIYSNTAFNVSQKQRLAFSFPKLKVSVIIGVSLGTTIISIFMITSRGYLYDSVTQFQLPATKQQKQFADMLERMDQGTSGERWVLYAPTAIELLQSMSVLNEQNETTIFPIAEVIVPPEKLQMSEQERRDFLIRFQDKLDGAGYDTEAFCASIDELVQPISAGVFEDSMSRLADALQGPLAFALGQEGGLFFSVFTIPNSADSFMLPPEVNAVQIAEREHLDYLLASANRGILAMCLFAFLLVSALLVLFFGFKDGLIVALLPLWTVLCANAILAVWSPGFSLISVIGSILGYCLALDYAAFAITERGKPLLSVRLSAVTSASAFAVLTTSPIIALSALGWSVCIPILIAWLGSECVNGSLSRNVLSTSQ
ncbi:MMPL family transporter [Rubellicoccus peritrichatus]|uniref:MMPL family transporter n=1 Tax=Rubellicoccus peritrichatus TaxID=3080537 RepID=A0AAQ3QWY4_9BACT|nr:MMPL family transporter [Puniceicoccus sp. CR14]WOO42330.1 MMPL family transporter [Puniceicoccus sp. CR14]